MVTLVLAAGIELGRSLFFDTRLSASCDQSCASCHQPRHAFSSNRAPSLTNVAERGIDLEKQAAHALRAELHYDGEIGEIAKALAAFERTIVSRDSPYDRLVFKDDEKALSPAAWRGMKQFFTSGCASCHRGINFESKDAPTLRNVALHEGSMCDALERHGVEDTADLIEFLESLTDTEFQRPLPLAGEGGRRPGEGDHHVPSSALRAPSPR